MHNNILHYIASLLLKCPYSFIHSKKKNERE
jgi:hypothetical protein